jgi:eIF4-gamma/eIF5/eIF2-epsilon
MVTSEKHQKALLGGIERLAGFDYPELIPVIPKILMEFYQADVLEEDVVTSWGTHVSKKYVDKETSKKVRKASEPFLKVNIDTLIAIMFLLTTVYSGSRRLRTMMTTKIERPCAFEAMILILYRITVYTV